jgi:hypothetical protein
MPSLGIWWAVMAEALIMLLLVGFKEAIARLPKEKKKDRHGPRALSIWERRAAQEAIRRAGRRKIGLAMILACIALFLFLASPDAPNVLDWTTERIGWWVKELGG